MQVPALKPAHIHWPFLSPVSQSVIWGHTAFLQLIAPRLLLNVLPAVVGCVGEMIASMIWLWGGGRGRAVVGQVVPPIHRQNGVPSGVAPATHLRNQQRLREALGCVRWLREVVA